MRRPSARPGRAATWALSAALSLAALATPRAARADLDEARTALGRGEYAQVEPALATVRGAQRAEADLLLGRTYLETGRYSDAQQLGARLARTAATRTDGLTLEGEALVAVGQYDQAIARWTQAVERARTGVGRRARALLTRWLVRAGRFDDARDLSNPLVDEYNDATAEAENTPDRPGRVNPRTAILRDAEALTYLGMALHALGHFQDANQAFNDAIRIDARRVETLVEHAELFLAKEDMAHAGESLRDALALNPHHARALALRARTRLMSDLDFTHANEDLDHAARSNPRLPDVLVLRAQVVLRDDDIAGAERLVGEALAINPRHLDALATRGTVRFYANDMAGFRAAFDELFRVSPVYVEAYALVGEFADWGHRYDEAVMLMREGLARPSVARDPRLQGWIRAQLGINLLRMGDEQAGLDELEESYRRDRYNVRVTNLLNLYSETIAHQYTQQTVGPFVIRYHNDEQRVLSRYVPALLRRAYDDMVRRYGFTPQGPLSIELFADNEHFSVRTAGLPEIGVQGVCFGKVITALSPRGGPFNWAQILWHELGHVFAIQRSRSRVPRWFTEGLSEWEAFHSHAEWSREDDATLYRAMQQGRVPRVAEFNTAFTHARSGDAVLIAYFAASKLVEFMIDRYGFERVAALLPLWGEGLATPEVLQRGLGVSADELDRQFRAHTTQRLARFANQFAVDEGQFRDRAALALAAQQSPRDAEALARSAAAELVEGDANTARERANAALAVDRNQALAHWVLARLALSSRDGAAALREIDAIIAAGRDGYELRALEARAARAARDETRLRVALEAATRQDPSQSEPWEALAEIHQRGNRPNERLEALRRVVALDQHDRTALRAVVQLLQERSRWADIVALREHATNLDPEEAATHATLGRALAETGARADAIFEYESALATAPERPGPIHLALARLYLAANDRAHAQESVRAALRANAQDAEARALAQQLGVR